MIGKCPDENAIVSKIPRLNNSIMRMIVVLCMLCTSFTVHAQKAYITKYKTIARELSKEYKIPVAVILGIAIVESSAGAGKNCKLLNNHFGLVGKNSLRKSKGASSRYKQYPDAAASYRDFCRMISKKRFYAKLKGHPDYILWIDAISKTGYSENAIVWKKRVIGVIKKNKFS